MKVLSEFLSESILDDENKLLDENINITFIKDWIKKNCDICRGDKVGSRYRGYGHYEINSDGTVDVDGSVRFKTDNFKTFPFQFNKVTSDFNCSYSQLTSLKGCPKEVGGVFYCADSPNLTSLEGAPEKVAESFCCTHCKNLKTLKGAPKEVGGVFWCDKCFKLTSLEGAPEKVGEDFNCMDCTRLISLEGAPKEVGGDFDCSNCNKLNDYNIKTSIKGEFIK